MPAYREKVRELVFKENRAHSYKKGKKAIFSRKDSTKEGRGRGPCQKRSRRGGRRKQLSDSATSKDLLGRERKKERPLICKGKGLAKPWSNRKGKNPTRTNDSSKENSDEERGKVKLTPGAKKKKEGRPSTKKEKRWGGGNLAANEGGENRREKGRPKLIRRASSYPRIKRGGPPEKRAM